MRASKGEREGGWRERENANEEKGGERERERESVCVWVRARKSKRWGQQALIIIIDCHTLLVC